MGKIEYKFRNQNSLLDNNRKGSMANKRRFDDSYIKFGFALINDLVVEKGSVRSMLPRIKRWSLRPSKLSNHVEKNHPELRDKSIKYFKRLKSGCTRQN